MSKFLIARVYSNEDFWCPDIFIIELKPEDIRHYRRVDKSIKDSKIDGLKKARYGDGGSFIDWDWELEEFFFGAEGEEYCLVDWVPPEWFEKEDNIDGHSVDMWGDGGLMYRAYQEYSGDECWTSYIFIDGMEELSVRHIDQDAYRRLVEELAAAEEERKQRQAQAEEERLARWQEEAEAEQQRRLDNPEMELKFRLDKDFVARLGYDTDAVTHETLEYIADYVYHKMWDKLDNLAYNVLDKLGIPYAGGTPKEDE